MAIDNRLLLINFSFVPLLPLFFTPQVIKQGQLMLAQLRERLVTCVFLSEMDIYRAKRNDMRMKDFTFNNV